MNIGIVTAWFERGAALVSKAYMETLSLRHNVFIYARGGEKYAQSDPQWNKEYVTWAKTPTGKAESYVEWEDFKEWVLKNEIQTVIFNEQRSWKIVIDALKLDITIGAYVDYYTPEEVDFFWLYDFLLCNTQRHLSVFKNHHKALYIPWGTNIEVFKPTQGFHSGNQVIFFHSYGISPQRKGTDLLVKTFQRVRGDAKLIIHAQKIPSNYPSWHYMTKKSHSIIELNPRMELIEKDVSAPGLYHMGDIYVYPSYLEGIGLTIAEALASGLPVITTDNPPMNEFVINNVNGKLVKVRKYIRRSDNYYWPMSICSEKALIEAMQFFVDNPNIVDEYKLRARAYAENHLDWKKNSGSLPELIEGIRPYRKNFDNPLIKKVEDWEKRKASRV